MHARFKRVASQRRLIGMKNQVAVLCALVALAQPHPVAQPTITYNLRVDSTNLSGWPVFCPSRPPSPPRGEGVRGEDRRERRLAHAFADPRWP